jgi:AcrR family transcriptional regulator
MSPERRERRHGRADRRERRQMRRRIRRDPVEARALILESAKRVLARLGPDRAGLKLVAREAGVSHALVTHYFGTYDALVEAALESTAIEAQEVVLARLGGDAMGGPELLIDLFFDLIERPLHGRLIAWALMTGRAAREDFFARRVQGPRRVAEAIVARLASRFPRARVDEDEIERMVLLVMAVGFGASLSGGALFAGLGREGDDAERRAFRRWLGEVVRGRLERMLGEPLPRA